MRVAKTVHLLPPTKAEMARSTQGYGSRGGAATAGEEATFPQWLKPFKVRTLDSEGDSHSGHLPKYSKT